ncbi:DUF5677 domain-containing protein [Cellulosimicrobium cellulans]|uniref:DUF5677 domain-containing protein n=1 Tax=Cellulosimicrobium cellulans TaxID=1710 RepID=UPI0036E7C7FA
MESPELADLVSWIEECVDHLRESSGFQVPATYEADFQILFGPAARTVRYAEAYLHLARANFSTEAIPLARAALEHAVTLQWVFLTDAGVTRFGHTVRRDHASHYRNLALWLDSDELRQYLDRLEPLPAGSPQMPPFMNLLRDLDHDGFLETSYHVFSQQVHVTHATVLSFLHITEGGPVEVTYDQPYPHRYQATYAVAAACMLARWVLAMLTDDVPLLKHLDTASDRLILPMNLLEQLPANRRRPGL